MSTSKYIILANNSFEEAVIFPDTMTHKEVANLFLANDTWKEVVAAGSVMVDDGSKVHCYGHSVSLNLQSRPGIDEKILGYTLGFEL